MANRMQAISTAVTLIFLFAHPLSAPAQTTTTTASAVEPSTLPTAADYDLDLALRDAINANYRLSLKQLYPGCGPDETLDDVTSRRLRANDLAGALDRMQLSVQFAPTNASHLYFYGQQLDKAGQIDRAVEIYNRFLALEPSTSRALNIRKRIVELRNPVPASQPVEP
jgi:tetratricopeptide (TPR) repeat protein